MRRTIFMNQQTACSKRKAYCKPKMNVHDLTCEDSLLLSGSILGGNGINNGGNASENENPPMDVKGEWGDIWDDDDQIYE